MAFRFESLDFILAGEPAVCSWAPGRLDVFARGTDQTLWHRWFDGAWSGWERLGPNPITASPCAVSWAPGRIDVFVRGTDAALYHKWYERRWSDYERLEPDPIVGGPAASSWGPGRIDVFVRGTDNALYRKFYDGRWHSYQSLGGVLTSDPAAVSWGPGRIDVVVRDLQNGLSHIAFEGQWGPWENLGGSLSTRPAICSSGVGKLDIFCSDSAGRVVQMNHPDWWGTWRDIGAETSSAVACVRQGNNRVDLFASGERAQLAHAWWDLASGWQPKSTSGPVAIVLSGGGSRGDFQVGALRCLYDRSIRPSIICGASVGSINAAKLAEGENPNAPNQGLIGLEALWAGMRVNSDMYLDEAWLADRDMDPHLADYLRGNSIASPVNPPTHEGPWGFLQWIANALSDLNFLRVDGVPLLKSLGVIANNARGLYNLGPIEQKMMTDFNPAQVANWAMSGGKLRLAMVSLDSGRLRYATESGDLIERDGTPVSDPDRVAAPCMALANELAGVQSQVTALQSELLATQDELRRAAPQDKPRLVAQVRSLREQIDAKSVALERKRAELDLCMRANPSPFRLQHIRLGILASASIPGIFLPVRIGREYYVDGGIREVIPIQAAVDLGATEVFAVHASSRKVLPFVTPQRAGLMPIVSRSLIDLTIDEIDLTDRDVKVPTASMERPKILHIEPEIDLHGITVIDPGLIRICRDYGYMRAADALDRVRMGDRRGLLATEIASLRREIWQLENRRAGQPDPTRPYVEPQPPDPGLQAAIDQKKVDLRNFIDERRRLNGPMPSDIDVWTGRSELHPWLNEVPNDAKFIEQSVPLAIRSGSTARVTVTMANIGTSSWDPARNYRLGSQNPQDNTIWGTHRIELPQIVAPGRRVSFAFEIPAPSAAGAIFQWQMVQDGVGWFGALTDAVRIANEAAECAGLRQKIAAIDRRIVELQNSLPTGDPSEDARIRTSITRLKNQRADLVTQAQSLGCAL